MVAMAMAMAMAMTFRSLVSLKRPNGAACTLALELAVRYLRGRGPDPRHRPG